jgi:hypothetical protein
MLTAVSQKARGMLLLAKRLFKTKTKTDDALINDGDSPNLSVQSIDMKEQR